MASQTTLKIARILQSNANWNQWFEHMRAKLGHEPTLVDIGESVVLRKWADTGAQSVQMPETFMAALLATDCDAAFEDDDKLPWPAFEVSLAAGVIPFYEGYVDSVIISVVPDQVQTPDAPAAFDPLNPTAVLRPNFLILFSSSDGRTCVTQARSIRDLARMPEPPPVLHVKHSAQDIAYIERIWFLLHRLLACTILLIHEARKKDKRAYAPKPPRTKHERVRPNVFQLGKPMTLDCRPSIREFVISGGIGSAPSVTTLVRGHFRNQAHGRGRALRKLLWIHPHYRGDGPMLIRPTKLDPDGGLEGLFPELY